MQASPSIYRITAVRLLPAILIAALGDKDAIRAAAAKTFGSYHDQARLSALLSAFDGDKPRGSSPHSLHPRSATSAKPCRL
jgi:hypothetical protein